MLCVARYILLKQFCETPLVLTHEVLLESIPVLLEDCLATSADFAHCCNYVRAIHPTIEMRNVQQTVIYKLE